MGHLALARHARAALSLERVLLMPAHTAPHKREAPDPGPAHRLAMCELAAACEPGVEASALEVDRGGTSYTVDTLRLIQDAQPHAELTFIVGADVGASLLGWREPAEILRRARLAIVTRTLNATPWRERPVGHTLAGAPLRAQAGKQAGGQTGGREALAAVASVLGSEPPQQRAVLLEMPPVEISSSMVRERIAAGEPIDALVPEAVAAYIAEHELYRPARADAAAAGGSS